MSILATVVIIMVYFILVQAVPLRVRSLPFQLCVPVL
jgi:hypothetical protein